MLGNSASLAGLGLCSKRMERGGENLLQMRAALDTKNS